MSIRHANDLTVIELKEKLRELGLPCSGSKNELIVRLNESEPSGMWFEAQSEDQATGDTEEATNGGANEGGTRNEALSEHHLRNTRILEMELEILRREVELLKAQSRTSAHVPETRVDVETRSMQPRVNMSAIAEFFATFDGATGNFDIWESQLRMLKRTYRLDDEHARILIGMRLRGKALEWLHLKTEFMEISLEALLCELKVMFDYRPSKVALRKKFEERMWRKGETFADYMHQKVISKKIVSKKFEK